MAINPPETSSINTDNVVNFFSNSADASVNSKELEDVSANSEDLEDVSMNNDDFEEVSINNDNLENDNDFFQNNDYNPSTQKMTDGPKPFQLFDSEYGLYFANFTEQIFFLWVTKHMICK